MSWVGDSQPDINFDLGLPRYDNSVCPDGSTDLELCDPNISTHDTGGRDPATSAASRGGGAPGSSAPAQAAPAAPGTPPPSSAPGLPDDLLPGIPDTDEATNGLEDLLGLPGGAAEGIGKGLGGAANGVGGLGRGKGGGLSPDATEELLEFLYGS